MRIRLSSPIIYSMTSTDTTTGVLTEEMLARFDERAPGYDREGRLLRGGLRGAARKRLLHRIATGRLRRCWSEPGRDQSVAAADRLSRPRCGALARLEGDVWMLNLCGFLGDHPPSDPHRFDAFARSLLFPDLHEAIRGGDPIDDPSPFRFAANVRRRYERTRHLPPGFLVLGDTLCSFNPIYGQGTTVAALQAMALRRCLDDGDERLPHRLFSAAATALDHAWNMATGAELALPGVEGPRNLQVRLTNAYTSRLLAAAAYDPAIAASFTRVAGMVDPLPHLLRPALVLRVLRPHTPHNGPARRRRDPHVGQTNTTSDARQSRQPEPI
jgi:2-polyprenyl-6-methoxyphenol hydroxylase-like FAD-dependent oxidoreductase